MSICGYLCVVVRGKISHAGRSPVAGQAGMTSVAQAVRPHFGGVCCRAVDYDGLRGAKEIKNGRGSNLSATLH